VKVYEELTDGLTRPPRVAELVYAAPGLPSRAEIDEERTRLQKDKAGLEIQQGDFVSAVLADPRCGTHLIESMLQPRPPVDLGPIRLERDGPIGYVIFENHDCLNAEDDDTTRALETAIDRVLLDDEIEVGVLRAGPSTHPKHAGRRIFGAGINLTKLYEGQISLVEFMLERELGAVSKLYRGDKPWIAVVESFAIGGACQLLLVMDRVIAESGSYFNLPARKEGIIPGCANLRLPRFVGERLARQAIFFGRVFHADTAEGRLIADEVVVAGEIDDAIERAAAELTSAGTASLVGNRRALRAAQEPLDLFRSYMSVYAREQARCLYSPGLIDNLERNWLRDSAGTAGTGR
jgi:(3,5-dihydroxyphenyl)acetyl-CoA 1,2-dioxygenase